MDRTYRLWFLLALVLALAPAGARSLLWLGQGRSVPLDMSLAQAGEVLFKHDFKAKDNLCAEGDGVGPLFNARSCVACHKMGGVGGAGGLEHNVTTYTIRLPGQKPREGVIHANSVGVQKETLADIHPNFPPTSTPTLDQLVQISGRANNHCLQFPSGVHVSQRNTPALFGAKLIDEIPDRVIVAGAKSQQLKWGFAPSDDESVPVGRALKLANGKIGRFGWKAQMGSLADFVQAACANEMGLSNPGQAHPKHVVAKVTFVSTGYDLSQRQCDELTAFCASLPKPVEKLPKGATEEQVAAGKKLFGTVGCAACHTPKLGDVDGIYSDLLLHRMGQDLVGGGSYGEPPIPIPDTSSEGPSPSEWRTPPLWGVADSAPYLHDGRAGTLEEAIRMHGGQAQRSATAFAGLKANEQAQVIAFLKSLRAPGQ